MRITRVVGLVWMLAVGVALVVMVPSVIAQQPSLEPTLDAALGTLVASDSEQACAGEYTNRLVNTRTSEPVVGATVTVLETGFTTTTNSNGEYRVRIPAPGAWTIRSTHPQYEPYAVRIVVSASTCMIVSRTVVEGGAQPSAPPTAPPAPPAPVATPRPATPPPPPASSSAGAHQFFGVLTIEGRPAPAGSRVLARVGETVCGRQETTVDGQYRIAVESASARAGCGQAGSTVQFSLFPQFGDGWQLSATATFQPGGSTQREISFDPRRLRPDAENVPWNSPWWDKREINIGVCGPVTGIVRDAINGALRQWRDATVAQGLQVTLVTNERAACSQSSPGIGILEDDIEDEGALAGAVAFDGNLDTCRRDTPCWAFKAVVVIDAVDFATLSVLDRANVVAHEIGHALGLGHARTCTGGTIMWADTLCRYPLSSIGVDDIASLNNKFNTSAGPLARREAGPEDQAAWQPGDTAVSDASVVRPAWYTAVALLENGDITRARRAADGPAFE